MVDQRLVIGGLIAAVLIVALVMYMQSGAKSSSKSESASLFENVHGMSLAGEGGDDVEMVHPDDMPAVETDAPSAPTSMTKEFPSSRSACGEDGDISNCPKYQQPTMVGESRAIYALHNGTLHDPRLNRERFSKYKPNLLSSQPQHEMEHPWENIMASVSGPGHELQSAYGYNMRQALISGSGPQGDEL